MSIAELTSPTPLTRAAPVSAPPPLRFPSIQPGQIWLVEPSASSGPCRHHAVDGANVVIYDRALSERMTQALPLGTYAEPAPALAAAAAARCVGFARDGWSVVRLFPARLPQRERTARVRSLVDALAASLVPGGLAVRVFAEAEDGICEAAATRLDDLARLVASYPRETRLTVVVDALDAGAAHPHAVAANGLAG